MVEAKFAFRYCGKVDGRHAFRAPKWKTSRRDALDALRFENQVVRWLIKNVPSEDASVGDGGSTKGFESLRDVAFQNNNALCVTLAKVSHVLAFERAFPVHGISPDLLIHPYCA